MNDINLFFLLFIFPNAIPGYQGQKEIFNVGYYKKRYTNMGKIQSVMELIKYLLMKLKFIKKYNLGRVSILSSGKTLEFHMVIDEDMEKNKKVMIKIL